MPNYRRAHHPGATFFFTVSTHLRQTFLIDADVRAALREGIECVRASMPFQIDAWVLLPDHLHCIWTLPQDDADFSTRWRIIKTVVTQRCARRLHDEYLVSERRRDKRQSSLWQQRFWEHQIRDEQDFERHVNYIHWNPVKHGYAKSAEGWPYSSIHRYLHDGLLPENWGSVTNMPDDGGEFGE